MDQHVALRLHFSGRVQGVYFRAQTRDKARELGLAGWVRNLPDGRVEALVEGHPQTVEALVDWCAHTMPTAKVTRIEREPVEALHPAGFTIRH